MILSLIFGFVAGIWAGSFFQINLGFFLAGLVLAGTLFVYRYFIEEKHRVVVVVCVVAIVGVLCGVARVSTSDLYVDSRLDKYAGERIITVGTIVDEPDVRESNTKLTVRLTQIENSKSLPCSEPCSATGVSEKVLVTVPIYPEFHYGDKVKAEIILSKPKSIDSDGRIFDYGNYLRVRGVWYISRFSKVELISVGHGAVVKTFLFRIKDSFTGAINNALPQPESSLMAGLLLGTKQSLGKELLSEFQRAGVSHVVVLSGYNIAIVASSVLALLKFLLKTDASASVQPTFLSEMFRPKTFSFGIGALVIILFTVLSGGGASAWRAAIMVLVALFAKNSNRDYKADRAFGLAVVVMLLFNPLLLVFDPSFQLSVLATIGLIFVSPFVEPYLTKVTEKYGLRLSRFSKTTGRIFQSKVLGEIVSTTIATQIVVLPYLIYTTGILSLVSLPVNVLILGTVPVTMLLGFITGAVGLFSLYLSFIPAFFAYILLWYQLTVVHLGATLPFGAINLPAFSPMILVLVYLIIFGIFSFRYFRSS